MAFSLHGMLGGSAIALALFGVAVPQSCEARPVAPSASPTEIAQTPVAVDAEVAAIEQAVFEQINAHRISQGLAPLENSGVIVTQSRQHSADMAEVRRISHDGFDARVDAIAESLSYRAAGENVASNQGFSDPATQAVQGWLSSPGHRRNIEGDFDTTGVGVVQGSDGTYYFTQIFIRSR